MKVDKYKDVYEKASSKLSDINRNVAFAGIGLIWIFTQTDTKSTIPEELILPAIFLVISLTCDMFQYTYKVIVWATIFRRREIEIKKNQWTREKEFEHSPKLNIPTWFFWGMKILLVLLAYFIILIFLIRTIM